MAKAAGVVEINGRRYNAVTGTVVGSVMDGFVRRKVEKKAKAIPADKSIAKPKANRPARTVSNSAKSVHKRTERSNTLLRGVLTKPTISIKKTSSNLIKSTHKAAAKTVDADKLGRARLIKKHGKVERFGNPSPKEEPPSKKILSGEVLGPRSEPKKAPASASAKPVSAPLPSMVTSTSHARLERMLDEALLRADAHKQALKHKSRSWLGLPRWLAILLALLVVLAAATVMVWRDIPAVAVKVAAMRSHVNASVPAYTPTGFGFNQAISRPGKLTIQYEEKAAAAHTYSVTEEKSDWDSQSLSDNSISKNAEVQTSQINGNTVYIYGPSSNAAWVNNGTLYTIKNNADLSSDQLLHIAEGL